MFFDEKASIEKTRKNVENALGRSLTDEEKSALAETTRMEVAKYELFFQGIKVMLIVGICCWILDGFTGIVSTGYTRYVEPYALWMISPHSDSVLSLLLQCYMWVLLVPIGLVLSVILLPAALVTFAFLWFFCYCARQMSEGYGMAFFLWTVLSIAVLPCLILAPLMTLSNTLKPMCQMVLPLYFGYCCFLKNMVFRLKQLSLGWWLFVTHIALPACLIILVVLLAA